MSRPARLAPREHGGDPDAEFPVPGLGSFVRDRAPRAGRRVRGQGGGILLQLSLLAVTLAERQDLRARLARLADGDRAAFDAVFRQVLPAVRAFTRRHLAPADADDAAQQALLSLFSRVAEYDPSRDALAFVLGIAAWEIRTARRRRFRRREDALSVDGACAAASPEAAAADAELRAALVEALGALRPADADALLAAAGLAQRPDVAGATFRKRVERATARLRELWRRCHGVD
jgi:RNA polymerase sigma factor (sigma-70 family)